MVCGFYIGDVLCNMKPESNSVERGHCAGVARTLHVARQLGAAVVQGRMP